MASALPIVDDVLGVVTIDMPVKNVVRLMSTSLENKNAIKRLFGDNFFRKLERVRIVSEAKKMFDTNSALFKATYCTGQLTPQNCDIIESFMNFALNERSCDVPIKKFDELYESQNIELLSNILDKNPHPLFVGDKNAFCQILALKPKSPSHELQMEMSLLCGESLDGSEGGSKRKRKSKRKSKRNIKRNIKRYKRKTFKKKK
jgi:hypothetical protein